jgi:hypothetical protein
MRLGADAVDVEEGTRAHAAYGETVITSATATATR